MGSQKPLQAELVRFGSLLKLFYRTFLYFRYLNYLRSGPGMWFDAECTYSTPISHGAAANIKQLSYFSAYFNKHFLPAPIFVLP